MIKFILICATGRSGSTTLQRIINTIPNTNITGENNGAIENLLMCYENIKYTNNITPKHEENLNKDDKLTLKKYNFLTYDELKQNNIKPCWYNSYDFEDVKESIKNTILKILSKHDCNILGYKEIRWFNNLHLLDEFIELFPNTKVICHLSDDIERQCKSDWWGNNIEVSRNHLILYNQQLIEYVSNNNNCYLSYMKNLFNVEEVKKIFLFLDEPFDENEYRNIINNSME
jgi:hypothetical protein